MATQTDSNTLPEYELKDFLRRLKDKLNQVAADQGLTRTALDAKISQEIGVKPDRIRKWCLQDTKPPLPKLLALFERIVEHSNCPVDFNYILLGTKGCPEQNPSNDVAHIRRVVDELSVEIEHLSHYMETNKQGIEGVVMRQSVRMLHALQGSPAARHFLSREPGKQSKSDLEPIVAGFIPDKLVRILERCSIHTRLATLRLDYEVISKISTAEVRPGYFFKVVVENLKRGYTYDFIIPDHLEDGEEQIRRFRKMLGEQLHQSEMKGISFLKTSLPLGAGFVLMNLDIERLWGANAVLAEEVQEDYILNDSCTLGMLGSPSTKMLGTALMDPERLRSAELAWEQYMETANPVDD